MDTTAKTNTVSTTIRELMVEALPIIEKSAPVLANFFHGRSEFIIGFIIPLLAKAFEVQPADVPGLVSSIANDPNAAAKLKAIEDQHTQPLSQLVDVIQTLNQVINKGA